MGPGIPVTFHFRRPVRHVITCRDPPLVSVGSKNNRSGTSRYGVSRGFWESRLPERQFRLGLSTGGGMVTNALSLLSLVYNMTVPSPTCKQKIVSVFSESIELQTAVKSRSTTPSQRGYIKLSNVEVTRRVFEYKPCANRRSELDIS